MIGYSYAKTLILKADKKPSEFVNWLFDERKNHNLSGLKGLEGIIFDRNCGGGSEIYVHYDLKHKLKEFLIV